MQLNKLTRLMAGAVIMFAITVAASIAAQAQYPGGYGNDVYRMAEEQGYRDGHAHGADHARQGRRYDLDAFVRQKVEHNLGMLSRSLLPGD